MYFFLVMDRPNDTMLQWFPPKYCQWQLRNTENPIKKTRTAVSLRIFGFRPLSHQPCVILHRPWARNHRGRQGVERILVWNQIDTTFLYLTLLYLGYMQFVLHLSVTFRLFLRSILPSLYLVPTVHFTFQCFSSISLNWSFSCHLSLEKL